MSNKILTEADQKALKTILDEMEVSAWGFGNTVKIWRGKLLKWKKALNKILNKE